MKHESQTTTEQRAKWWNQRPLRWAGGLVVLTVALWLWFGSKSNNVTGIVFAARRGPLQIKVLEGGSIEAREAQEVRSEIKGYQGTKILTIVEEGYLVTEDDVKKGKVLVELDSSDLRQRIITQDIQVQSTRASLVEATQGYEIQLNQNRSDIKAAEQLARFALMDMQKYLGDKVTTEVLEQLGLPTEKSLGNTNLLEDAITAVEPSAPSDLPAANVAIPMMSGPGSNAVPPLLAAQDDPMGQDPVNSSQPGAPAPAPPKVTTPPLTRFIIDFTKYADTNKLGDGEAKQKLRQMEDDLLVAQTERGLAETKFEGTQRLRAKDFVTKTELDNEELALKKSVLKVQTARTALDLFIKYEFPKTAEQFLSKYDEALRGLERAIKEAVSRREQALAKLRSAQSRYRIEVTQQKELYDQLDKCVIRAQKTGLVIYGGGGSRRFNFGEDQIREGVTVRERQPIITIPDMTHMTVQVKIHEAQIQKVKKGMKAQIVTDAFPERELTGEVGKVGVLPDSQDRWMNPDMKVYLTTIAVDGTHDWLKPGMSAKVEILVNELTEVVYVPLQAVIPMDDKRVCYVLNNGEPEAREVEVGEFSDEFIEIKKGINEGDRVLLQAPTVPEPAAPENGTPANDEIDKSKRGGEEPKRERPEDRPPRREGPLLPTTGKSSTRSAT